MTHDALTIWQAGVAAVRADNLVAEAIDFDSRELRIGDESIDRRSFDRILIVGAGKAVAAMTTALEHRLAPAFDVRGWVNVPEGTFAAGQATRVTIFAARPAGANEPTAAVVEGTRRILQMVDCAGAGDLCLCVLSGGGSALLAAPIPGVSLADKLAVTRHLSGGGATITELNAVRTQLSLVKGGGLARACRAAALVTLVLSDVLGDPLDVIASGPTVARQSTATDALAILSRFDPDRELPKSIYDAISLGSDAANATKTNSPDRVVVLANNATAVDAAGIRAEQLGYNHAMHSATMSEGLAESIGIQLAEMAVSMLASGDLGKPTPNCLITGGEPTVRLPPASNRGRGGRNTHLVLAAMKHLTSLGLDQSILDRITILSGGTDGEDGPTDAAGAMSTAEVWREAIRQQLDIADFLQRCDSYEFFDRCGGLVKTGPTHTNVCDVRVVVINNNRTE